MKNFLKENDSEVTNAEDTIESPKNSTIDSIREKLSQVNWKKTGMIAGIIVAVLLVIYIGLSIFFQSHFYFRSTVNGVNASAKSVESVEDAILAAGDDYKLTILGEDSIKDTIASADVDMTININAGDKVGTQLKQQNGFAWIKYLFHPKEYVCEDLISYDEQELADLVAGMNCVTNEKQTPTENATFAYKDGEYVVKDEVYGTQIDQEQFTKEVGDAITSLKEQLDLKEDKCYVQPTITADSKELKNLIKTLNAYLNVNITYQVGDATEQVSKDEMVKWITATDDLQPAFHQDAMTEYVKTMAKKYNTYGQSKQLATSYGSTVTVPGGNYGWKIDNEGEVTQLMADIQGEKDVTRDFIYSVKANSRGANDYGNSYVEINLTAQHLYLYKDGKLVVESDFVSGNPSKGNGSPSGAYKVTYTEANATLRGQGYATPVKYWMPFAGNVGMHDANWRKSFGGTIYKTNGSHGCINLPTGVAKTIFNNIGTGYAVLCYTLPGTENNKASVDSANTVIAAIDAIGNVTLNSEGAIVNARNQYNALTEESRGYVTNLAKLEAAEAALNQQKADAANAAAQAQAAQQAATEKAKADAANVTTLIGQMGSDATLITNAYNAYNALSSEAKSYVAPENVTKVTNAYTALQS